MSIKRKDLTTIAHFEWFHVGKYGISMYFIHTNNKAFLVYDDQKQALEEGEFQHYAFERAMVFVGKEARIGAVAIVGKHKKFDIPIIVWEK